MCSKGCSLGPSLKCRRGSYRAWRPGPLLPPNCFGPSHAVPSSQVPVHKLLFCQVLHATGYLQAEADEVLHCGVLGAKMGQQASAEQLHPQLPPEPPDPGPAKH